MKARSIWSHGWRRFVDWMMLRTYGYAHADVNMWRRRIYELGSNLERTIQVGDKGYAEAVNAILGPCCSVQDGAQYARSVLAATMRKKP